LPVFIYLPPFGESTSEGPERGAELFGQQ